MPVVKISVNEIKYRVEKMNILPDQKDAYLYDTELKGFGVKVSTRGKVTYFVERRFANTKNIRKTIGNWPEMGLDESRQIAVATLGQIAAGIDVSKEKRDRLSRQRATLDADDLNTLYQRYFETIDDGSRYRKEQRQAYEREVAGHIGHLPAAQVTKSGINDLLENLGSAGAQRAVFALLRPFFKWMVHRDLIVASPMADLVQPRQPQERDRVLSDAELTQYVRAAMSLHYPWKEYFLLLLYTCQRRQEVSGMVWRELNLNAATWTIPAGRYKKGKKPQLVPLSRQAVALLRGIQPISEWVLSTNDTTPISGYAYAKKQIDQLMPGVAHWNAHRIRATGSTIMQRLGHRPDVIDLVQGHRIGSKVRRAYQLWQYEDDKRRALQGLGDFVERLVQPKGAMTGTFTIKS
jgi:integrase